MKDVNLMNDMERQETALPREIEWLWKRYHDLVHEQLYMEADQVYERIVDANVDFEIFHGKPYVRSEWYD